MTYVLDDMQERQEAGVKQTLDSLSVVGLLSLRWFIEADEAVGGREFRSPKFVG